MTGQKNRFTTTEKLWNLDDKQLKTPNHDALVLWFMDNWKQLISFTDEEKFKERCVYLFDDVEIKSEYPVMSSPTFLAGYIDIALFGRYIASPEIKYPPFNNLSINHYIEVKPYVDSFGAVLRQINSYKRFLGCSHRVSSKYYLFTLDDRFDSQFETQNITTLHPPADFDIAEVREHYGLV